MSHFNWKSLTFYGIAIGSVLVLFKVVTAYGETNLKAPPSISGHYRLPAENLPKCRLSEPLFLTVKQSGIYIRGALSAQKSLEAAEEQLSLSGQFQPPNLTLSGSIPQISGCNLSGDRATIQATWEKDSLQGQITFNSASEIIDFTAQREAVGKSSEQKH